MSMATLLLEEFELEARTARRFLEQLDESRLTWRPHPKSNTAGQLALHIAQVPASVLAMAQVAEHEMPDFSKGFSEPGSLKEILDAHDQSTARVRSELPKITDDQMEQIWHGTLGGRRVLTMPRRMLLRLIMLNHWVHHRGQFGVYLRLLGAIVPSSYGPSADEQMARK